MISEFGRLCTKARALCCVKIRNSGCSRVITQQALVAVVRPDWKVTFHKGDLKIPVEAFFGVALACIRRSKNNKAESQGRKGTASKHRHKNVIAILDEIRAVGLLLTVAPA